ncbi:MAG: oligosaccharyl transferase, archaeosortase A system-associated [Methanolinea sp.]|jgi:dolichyl-diphosphooligosaccharide--protein glycosyltransferase|nr:oligosaccharyl transferase, archaeosortase A system-associated [Methanolinea sp.]
MEAPGFMHYKKYLIIIFLAVIALFMIWIRMLPAATLGSTDILNLVGSDDPLYNLRQIEQMNVNFPNYNWFEAMTLYPFGQIIHWGPLFIWIISGLCLLTGATTRPEIISLALLIPPIMAALMVPVMYLLGKKISDTTTGLFSAFFIAAIGGQFFFRSLYGYLDHHIAEVLFSTVFGLCYVWALVYTREHPVDLSRMETLQTPLLISVACGVTYVLGLLVMPTMVLFALVVAIFTFFQCIWHFLRGIKDDSLFLINTVTFGIAAASFLLFGVHKEGLQFDYYTLGHPLAYLFIIAATAILFLFSRVFEKRGPIQYAGALAGLVVILMAAFAVTIPDVFSTFTASISQFFGQNPLYLTIQEARSWTVAEAWNNFSIGLILMAVGGAALCYTLWRQKREEHLFVLIWVLLVVYSTWQHIRYEYYFAVPLALLSGLFVGVVLEWGGRDLFGVLSGGRGKGDAAGVAAPPKGKQKEKKPQKVVSSGKKVNPLHLGAVVLVLILAVAFAYLQVSYEYQVSSSGGIRMNQDWRESLDWLGTHTPDPGIDYYRIYDGGAFQYPEQSYGVMSWWDYGHMITYISKRIPNANPFQSGVAGENGAATFFLAETEERNTAIADTLGVRYVMTDIEMDTGKFWAMATWYNSSAGQAPYVKTILAPETNQPETYGAVTLYDAPYFRTMISRFHNFDGSMAEPGQAYYIEVDERRSSLPVATMAQVMNVPEARAAAEAYNQKAMPGTRALVLSPGLLIPLDPIPALRHYRLVHESPTNVMPQSPPDIKYVKVFEYVPGARIRGTGVIALDVVTNTGRIFTYRQASTGGEFIVPYATTGSSSEVKAIGRYRIEGTGQEFDVSEEAVMQGLQVG